MKVIAVDFKNKKKVCSFEDNYPAFEMAKVRQEIEYIHDLVVKMKISPGIKKLFAKDISQTYVNLKTMITKEIERSPRKQ